MLLEPDLVSPALVLPAGAEFGGPLVRPVLAPGGAPLPAVVLATLNASSASAASLAPPVALVGAGALGAGVAVTRAHTPTGATTLQRDAAGVWQDIAANQPRYAEATRRLIVHPEASSAIRNPRAEGVVPGVPGTAPTHWGSVTTDRTINGVVTVDGLPLLDLTYAPAGAGNRQISLDTNTISASPGETWTVSGFVALVSGACTARLDMEFRDGGGAVVAGGGIAGATLSAVDGVTRRVSVTGTAPASTTRITVQLRLTFTNATTARVYYGVPQLERGASASSPILPAVGSPAITTRGADVPIWTPAPFPTRGAILLRGRLDALAGASALGLLQLDNGTDNFRIVARIAAGGGQPEVLVITSGLTLSTLTPTAALTAGSEFRALVAWSPGGVRFGTNAGGVVSAAVARPAGLTRALLGQANAAGTLPLGGEVTADLYDYWPSAAEALALLTA